MAATEAGNVGSGRRGAVLGHKDDIDHMADVGTAEREEVAVLERGLDPGHGARLDMALQRSRQRPRRRGATRMGVAPTARLWLQRVAASVLAPTTRWIWPRLSTAVKREV